MRIRSEYLSKLDICKPMGPDGMHPQMLRELADVMAVLDNPWSVTVIRMSAQRKHHSYL